MPPRAPKLIETDAPEIELEEGERPEAPMLDILSELGATPGDDNFRFTVAHVLGASKDGVKEPQILEGDASIMEGLHTRLRQMFKHGRFRVRVYKNKRLCARHDIEVSSPPDPLTPTERPSEMATVLAAIQQSNERTQALFERMLENRIHPQNLPVAAPTDPFDMMTKMVGFMGTIMEKITPAQGTSAADLVIKGVELANKLREGNEGGGETSMMDILKELIRSPLLETLSRGQPVAQPMAGVAPLSLQPPSNPQATPPRPQIPAQPQPNGQEAEMQSFIRQGIMYLVTQAKKNSDAGFYADWVFDNWDRGLVYSLVQRADLVQLMISFVPDAAPHRAWFEAFVVALREIAEDAKAEENQAAHAPANPSPVNAVGNPGGQRGGEANSGDDEGIDDSGEEKSLN